jgi:NADPH:quinone reductase
MKHELPRTMRAVELAEWGGPLRVIDRALPVPGPGEVLVRIAASPINPSDLMFVRGLYGVKKPLPTTPGFEGSGRVVASGGGLQARALVGRRVACSAGDASGGTWAEYMVTAARRCVPLRPRIDDEAGAMLIVNPITAWALLAIARRDKTRAFVQTAAASALGRMLVRMARKHKIASVNVVRRAAQVELLRREGAEHVLDSSAPDFAAQLRERCRALDARVAFDAVAGEMTGTLTAALPGGSRVVVYGALSEAACVVDPSVLIFGGRRVEGFWLSDWFRRARLTDQARAAVAVQSLAELRSDVRERVDLDGVAGAIARYAGEMSAGKVLVTPNRASS